MKGVIERAFDDPAVSTLHEKPENGTKYPTAKTILQSALEVYRERVEALAVKEAAVAMEESQSEGERWARSAMAETKAEKNRNTSISEGADELWPEEAEPADPAEATPAETVLAEEDGGVEEKPVPEDELAAVNSKEKDVAKQVAEEVKVATFKPGFAWGWWTAKDEKYVVTWNEPVQEEPAKLPDPHYMLGEGEKSAADGISLTVAIGKKDKKGKKGKKEKGKKDKKKGRGVATDELRVEGPPAEPPAIPEPELEEKDNTTAIGITIGNDGIFGGF
jgi:hypothetical protein